MATRQKKQSKRPRHSVTIGGRKVPLLTAALMASEAHRLGVTPGEVGEIAVPSPPPEKVTLGRVHLSIFAAAQLAVFADKRQLPLSNAIRLILKMELVGR